MVFLIAGLKWFSEGMFVGVAYKLRGNYTFKECGDIGKIGDGRIVGEEFFVKVGFLEDGVHWATLKWLGTVPDLRDRLTILVRVGIRFEG